MAGKVVDNILSYLDSVLPGLVSQYVDPGLEVRCLDIGRQSPLKTGQKPVFHTLQVGRCLVGSQHKLFSALMQVIKDVEKSVLRTCLSSKLLNIVKYQDVDHLIEIQTFV